MNNPTDPKEQEIDKMSRNCATKDEKKPTKPIRS